MVKPAGDAVEAGAAVTRTLASTAPTSLGPSQQIPGCSPDGKHGGRQQRQNLDHSRTACLHTTRHGPGPLSVHADLDVIPDGKAGRPQRRVYWDAPSRTHLRPTRAARGVLNPVNGACGVEREPEWTSSFRISGLAAKRDEHAHREEQHAPTRPTGARSAPFTTTSAALAATPGQSSGADSNRPFSSPTPVAGSSTSRRKTSSDRRSQDRLRSSPEPNTGPSIAPATAQTVPGGAPAVSTTTSAPPPAATPHT